MEISINVEECEVGDFLDLLSGNLKKQKIIHIAKALLEAINTYHKDLHADF